MGYVSRDPEDPSKSRLMGRYRQELIYELAKGDVRPRILARRYGVTTAAIHMFRRRHQFEIDDVKGKLDDRFSALWIADKRARLAELEEMADILYQAITETGGDVEMMKARAAFMKQAAEELGQLPPRQQTVAAQVTHRIIGISEEELEAALT